MTYKHLESNYKKLKKVAALLDRNMGDLIDEALNAKMPEWQQAVRDLNDDLS
jgi:hypothetical protein